MGRTTGAGGHRLRTEEATLQPTVPPIPDPDHRRYTRRQARHEARARLRAAVFDEEELEDVDLRCPRPLHDLGAHTSPPPPSPPKEGRRGGFKVWKTPYWKRRTSQRAARAAAERAVAAEREAG